MDDDMKLLVEILFLIMSIGTAMAQSWLFEKYPAVVFHGKSAPLKPTTQLARQYPTAIRASLAHGPNFAGHYTVASWGCGTSCAVFVVVDSRTGKVYEPAEISKGVSLGVGGPEFRVNSTLMVVANCAPPEVYGLKGCERKFYIWDGSRLLLLKTEPVTSTDKH